MTLHPNGTETPPLDPMLLLEDALRVARAACHSRRLDSGTQAALDGIIQYDHAVVDLMRVRDAQLSAALSRLTAVEQYLAGRFGEIGGDPIIDP